MVLDPNFQEYLRKNSLFQEFSESDFSTVVDHTTLCELKTDDILFRQQQKATDFFLLADGKIKLSLLSIEGTEKIVDIIFPGSTFAEAIILNGLPGFPVNAVALSDSNVLRINAEAYTNILNNSPKTCIKVMATLSMRLHKLMGEINRLSLHNATYRLISYLLENIPDEAIESTEVHLSIPKHVVASRISVTPETLSRTLKRLCQEGLLEVHDSNIVLVNPVELRRMVSI